MTPADVTWGLADAIRALRSDLANSAPVGDEPRFSVESMTIQLQVVTTRDKNGKVGFRVPIVDLELGVGASAQHESTSSLTIVLGPPLTADGHEHLISGQSSSLKR
ncbi:trypco2 family protein [Cellulosimicrobium cellulans]|uniref:trypco2 family protein n=1 Tax=Cellulosimicrobium cellulans TaxID=1710 RepID=UPI0024073FCF|nr:trypco2 family protein [Cellulosimicrobium cellulans]MDF9876376.1 hypothetical protein [Cellulosimicrobium cellulans]